MSQHDAVSEEEFKSDGKSRKRVRYVLILAVFLSLPLILPGADLASVLITTKPVFASKTDTFWDGGSSQHHGLYYTIWDGRDSFDPKSNFIKLKLVGVQVFKMRTRSNAPPIAPPSNSGDPF
ncbi:MAG: hypothetical protein AAF711_16635 [Planctomycetota bacterium]